MAGSYFEEQFRTLPQQQVSSRTQPPARPLRRPDGPRASPGRQRQEHRTRRGVRSRAALAADTGFLRGAAQAFERELFRAATRQPAEGESNIFMCKGLVVVYRSHDETTFFVVGSDEENEVILVRAPAPSEAPLQKAPLARSCFATRDAQMRALGIGSPLLIMSCACLLFAEELGAHVCVAQLLTLGAWVEDLCSHVC